MALASSANAEDLSNAFKLEAPQTYAELPGMSEKMATTASQGWFLDTRDVDVGARVWARAGRGALYVTWFVTRKPVSSPESSIRSAFDILREAPVAASPQVGSTQELSYREKVGDNLAEATLSWRHLSNETTSTTRAFAWAAPNGKVRLIRAECVVGTEAGALAECEAALTSIAITDNRRKELGDIGVSAPPEPPSAAEAVAMPDAGSGGPGETPSSASISAAPEGAGGGKGRVLYQGDPPKGEGSPVRRYLMIFGGLLLLLGLYNAWKRRQSDEDVGAQSDEDDEGEGDESEGDEGEGDKDEDDKDEDDKDEGDKGEGEGDKGEGDKGEGDNEGEKARD